LTLFIFLKLTFLAQVPYAYNFSDLHSFSPNTIFFSYEDEERNMWFGTDEGLYKWSGSNFKSYQNSNYSISYSSIQEDNTGRIWCQNFTGQLFYVENDSLKLFIDTKEWVQSSFNYSVAYYPEIYLTSNYGLLKYDFYTKERNLYKEENYNRSIDLALISEGDTAYFNRIKNLSNYNNGLLYWSGELLKFKEANKKSKTLANLSSVGRDGPFFIFSKNNKMLLLSNSLLNKKQPSVFEWAEDGGLKEIGLDFDNELNASSIFYDDENKLYLLGTKSGVAVLNEEYKSVFNRNVLSNKNVSHFTKDAEGNYWVSTLNSGIYIIPSFALLSFNDDFIKGKQVSFIIKTTNNKICFVEEFGDVYSLNEINKIEYLGSFNESVENVVYNPFRNELYAGNLRTSFNLNTNKLETSVYGRDIKSISFLDTSLVLTSTSGSSNLRIVRMNDSINPLIQTVSKSSSFVYNYNEKNRVYTIRGKRSMHNCFDFQNNIAYISYTDGLFFYRNGVEKEILYNDKPIALTTISKVNNEYFWLTTISGNLLQINKGEIKDDFEIGIRAKEILSWENYLFMSTSNGVLKYNIDTKHQNWIDTLDGLPSNDILDIEIDDDLLYVATSNGVINLPCAYNYINKTPPLISISNVAIWEKDTILHTFYSLEHNQNNITVYFEANATRSQKQYVYKYRMLGIDSTWISQPSEINFVRFPIIPSGAYTFQVKTINEDGIESEIAEIEFNIDSPFYQKWWFYVLIGLFIVLIVSVIFLIRIRVIRQQNRIKSAKKEVEKQLSQSQLTALRSQMNPHFIFNALNSIQDYIISNNKLLASDYLGLFADLMRKYLHFSNEDEITLEEEVESLDMYLQLEQVRFEETLAYTVNVSSDLDVIGVKLPVMLIQPFAENAIKHGLLHKKGERILDIEFLKEGQNLIITIKDNGIGRKQSAEVNKMRKKEHKSFATSAQQKRIELINQSNDNPITIEYIDLYDDSNNAEGTLVNISVPL